MYTPYCLSHTRISFYVSIAVCIIFNNRGIGTLSRRDELTKRIHEFFFFFFFFFPPWGGYGFFVAYFRLIINIIDCLQNNTITYNKSSLGLRHSSGVTPLI